MVGMITSKTAAKILGIQRQMVNKHVRAGNLPYTQVGRDTFFKRSDVMKFKKNRRKPGWQHPPKGKAAAKDKKRSQSDKAARDGRRSKRDRRKDQTRRYT